ncbi:oligosaccharide repeat unit polymerase [Robertmurraya kyonggiensis]|uniref:Oligosaccharide repeat unit polymerase n=1 Tax=Robertmurraya kyonggiensis TaxID=1037680 RepID=A0A4U1D7H3_9BACI|nr:oligosaccharide repeat unit polymerase [Robertmurraya kyonggiensis]TKC17006.1 oligosaccharide repeat unit polymerase [Robertmurraya kyonggiensis]
MNTSKQTKFLNSDFFAPYIFFPFVFLIYFLAGYLFNFGRTHIFYLNQNNIPVLIVGFVAYFIGVLVFTKLNWSVPRLNLKFINNRMVVFIYLLGIIGLISFLIMIFTGQIGIADESVRRHLDPRLNFLSSFLWFSVLVLFFYNIVNGKLTKRSFIINLAILGVVFVLFILSGYRTPLIIMVLTSLLCFHYIYKRIPLKWIMVLFILMSVTLSVFGYLRTVTEDKTEEFNQEAEVNLDEEDKEHVKEVKKTPEFVLAITAEFVNGRIVLSRILEYTEEHGYMNGEVHKSIFSTILPGEQISPRMHITNMVNSLTKDNGVPVTREGRTTVPTIVGQFYADGGYILLAIGLFIVGAILAILYNDVKKYGFKSYSSIVYSFFTTIFVLGIHTGILDLLFLLMLAFLLFTLIIYKPKTRN